MNGVSYASYSSDPAACDRVFISTISAAAEVSADFIVDLVVRDAANAAATLSLVSPLTLSNLRAAGRGTSNDAVSLQYTIQVPSSSGVTYDQLASALSVSVQSGQFTTQMQGFAIDQGVSELSSASSSSVETRDTTVSPDNNDSSSGLSVIAVVGIVIGVLAAVLLCSFLAYRTYLKRDPVKGGFQDLSQLRGEGLALSPMHQRSEL